MVPNVAESNEVENMMTSFPVFDTFLFSGIARSIRICAFPNLKRKFKAVLGDKRVTAGISKGQ